MDLTKLVQSKTFIAVVAVIAVLIIAFVSFGIGISVGYHKARFSYQWSENYDQNFGGPRHGIFGIFGMGMNGFMNAHGISGSIIKIDGSTLIVGGKDNIEKAVLIKNDTMIRRGQETVKSVDLKVNDKITIIGDPNDSGQIEAKFIRLLPTPFPSQLPPPMHPR